MENVTESRSNATAKKRKVPLPQSRPERGTKPFLNISYGDWILGLILLVGTLQAYQPAWNGTPIWDDELNITSPGLRSVGGLAQIWTRLGATQQYYPLVHSVWWAAFHAWGDSPLGYHLLNILLHVFSALLLVMILRRLGIRGAWLAGGIFALHPVMVESVAWITELKNTLSGVFFLGTALAYVTCIESGKRRWHVLSLGLFILGLLSKTAIAPFPLAMLAVVWWKRGRLLWRRDVVPLLPFFLAGILSGLITFHVERALVGAEGREFGFSFIERCLIAGRAIWFYLSKVFLPVNLIFIYPRWTVNGGVWWQYLFPLATLTAGCVLWAVRGRWRSPLAVFLYFIVMLLPVIGFFNVYAFLFSFVADHWQYCAAIGPIAMSAGAIDRALRSVKGEKRFLKPVISGVLLLVLGILTWQQSGRYADAETLYRTTIRKNPDCWMAYNNLGLIMANTGRTDDAVTHYRRALEIKPDFAKAHYNLANVSAGSGRTDEAIMHYGKALHIDSTYGAAHINLGNTLLQTGRVDEAIVHYRKAVEINPLLAESNYNLGTLLARTGQMDEAMLYCRKAIAINPNYVEAYNNLGRILMQTGQMNEAVGCYLKALEIKPDDISVLNNLSVAFQQVGRPGDAMPFLRKALAMATATGQEAQATTIAEILARLHKAGRSPP
jgi:tetratricopeptide (TPR) repeat protein